MSCRACHLVDEHHLAPGGGNRTYADVARLSPIPAREDGLTTTPRNSPALVGIADRLLAPTVFHFDGEFRTLADLVMATLTGRNFGWLPVEHDAAVRHVAAVIREDDGRGALARAFTTVAHASRVVEELFELVAGTLLLALLLHHLFRLAPAVCLRAGAEPESGGAPPG